MPVTFDEEGWRDLTGRDAAAIKKLAGALNNFEPLAKFSMPGPVMVRSLIDKGLAEAGPCSRPAVAEVGYRLTKKDWLANEWRTGNRMREYPEGD